MYNAGDRFRLKTPTLAVAPDESGVKVAAIVPAGAIVELIEQMADTAGLVFVRWGGMTYEMFSVDLRERGEYTTSAPISSANGKNVRWQSTHLEDTTEYPEIT